MDENSLTEIGMKARDARLRPIIATTVSMTMVVFFVVTRAWTWTPLWVTPFSLAVIGVVLWQGWRSPFERTVVYRDRLETRRRSGVVSVIARDAIDTFRLRQGGEGDPLVLVVDVDGRTTTLLGTDNIGRARWIDNFRPGHRHTDALVTQFEHWRTHGRWE
ncbi:hypothetical protein HQ314_19745 [Rhodococcus sp. BP-332]|uniref:hypothetical protein n=1 Tax=Rhodococcus sp. BP-332 TaxID=2739447 RepID=UPI001C9B3B54|nr:hypothetical protein [Rhodococcus sp. BP-332]MBY6679153.1 hypothetical protein [Rhodococcus sp. BP-332]